MCAKMQDERVQYDTCDATAGSGRFDFNGFCVDHRDSLMLHLEENSQSLENTINFRNNKVYYLTSNASVHTRYSQCI